MNIKYFNTRKILLSILCVVCALTLPAQRMKDSTPDSPKTKIISQNINLDSIGKIIDSLNNLLLLQTQVKYFDNSSYEKADKNLHIEDRISSIQQFKLEDTLWFFNDDKKRKKIEGELKMAFRSYYGPNNVTTIPSYISSTIPPQVIGSAKCVCAIIHKSHLVETSAGYVIKSSLLRQKKVIINEKVFQLCDNEPYIDQINPAIGTGWAYKNDLIVTADHCFNKNDLNDYKNYFFVFDFLDSVSGAIISKDRVFIPVGKIKLRLEDLSKEFTIIQVNRTIPKSRYAQLYNGGTSTLKKETTKLYMIGHPLGLPLKYTPKGQIYKLNKDVLITNLDAYAGNSGSPVFDSQSNKIVGILVSGNEDFEKTSSGCCRSVPYAINYPLDNFGEKVVRIINALIKY
ncbi:MAG: serine protease [Bacteroidetes bacterium]|nr:MAG: serine protease [Bacteroidota bacterium]